MDCTRSATIIPAFVDGELSGFEIENLLRHVAECSDCSGRLCEERKFVARMRVIGQSDVLSPELRSRLLELLAAQSGTSPADAMTSTVTQTGFEGSASVDQVVGRPRSGMGRVSWLVAGVAAALLMALLIPFGSSGNGVVKALAAEHLSRTSGGNYGALKVSGDDRVKMESFLTRELGISVKLPEKGIAQRLGACCAELNGRKVGMIGCFCSKRKAPITLFIVPAGGLDIAGLKQVSVGSRQFLIGSSGSCNAALWRRGDLLYALVSNIDPKCVFDMAVDAAARMDSINVSGENPEAGGSQK
jgi:anti-sigma factor RsiW